MDSEMEDGMSEKLSQQMLRAIVDKEWIGASRRLGEMWAMDVAALESELAQAKAELDSLRTWKRSVDEALNSGDGTYRP